MPEINPTYLFGAVIIAISLLFISTIACVSMAMILSSFKQWIAVSLDDLKRLTAKCDNLERRLHESERQQHRNQARTATLFQMMHVASDMNLTGEEISKKIKDRLKKEEASDVEEIRW